MESLLMLATSAVRFTALAVLSCAEKATKSCTLTRAPSLHVTALDRQPSQPLCTMPHSPRALWLLGICCLLAVSSGARLQPQDAAQLRVEGATVAKKAAPLPVVLWHGMGDSCCASYSIGSLKTLIEEKLGVFVYSIATGDTPLSDIWSSYFGNVNDQVAQVCEQLRSVPELAGGYNAIGFSQGGQFMRAVVQRCQHLGPKAKILITLGAQHQGVANIPGCNTVPSNLTHSDSDSDPLSLIEDGEVTLVDEEGDDTNSVTAASACETMQTILSRGAYLAWVRDHVVQAQYFKDPTHYDSYVRYNPFLPDINNERPEKLTQYADNLASLDKLVLFRFADDTTVVPRDSSWFWTMDENRELVPLEQQDLWKEDWLGLRRLSESGRLSFEEAPGRHMQFSMEWFESTIMWGYLAGESDDTTSATAALKA